MTTSEADHDREAAMLALLERQAFERRAETDRGGAPGTTTAEQSPAGPVRGTPQTEREPSPAPPGRDSHTDNTLIRVGYAHAALVDTLRPDIAYPARKVRRARKAITEILAEPCTCTDAHIEIWACHVP